MNRFFVALTAVLLVPLGAWGDVPRNSTEGIPAPDKIQQAWAFDLNQVHLLDGPFKHAQELDRQYLLSLDLDVMLYPFRREAKLPSPVTGSDDLSYHATGHYLGHCLSACALMVRNTGDVELKKRADAAVAVLAECQARIGTGFVMGFPERGILELARLNPQRAEKPLHVGVPWYCIHKVYAGLLDMYLLTGNRQALDVLERSAQWTIKTLSQIDDQQMQDMLRTEHGGMNEVLANLYAVTGKEEYLKLSLRFNHHLVMDPFARGEDPLDLLHANTQIPKFIGVARQYALSGDPALRTIACGFWENVTRDRSYVTGGNSEKEHFSPKARLSRFVHSGTAETCNSYNMLKLTRNLFCQDPRAAYADYYERTLYNHILSSQDPKTGAMLYFQELEAGRPKSLRWSDPKRPSACCHASGLENHAKYADSIYFHDGRDGLFVNLFIACELDWKDKGLILRQETRYPEESSTRLLFTCEKPVTLRVNLRRPWWATENFEIKLNGQPLALESAPGSYASVARTWQQGDALEIAMPMTLHMEGFQDNPRRAAVLYGPVVLAAITEPDDQFAAICANDEQFLKTLRPIAGKPLEFVGPPAVFRNSPLEPGAQPVVFRPLFRLVDEPKVVYWDVLSAKELERIAGRVKCEADRLQSAQSETVDLVLCDPGNLDVQSRGKYTFQGLLASLDPKTFVPSWFKQVAEKGHGFEMGPTTGPQHFHPSIYVDGLFCPMRFVPQSWFAYRMRVLPNQDQRLQVRLWLPASDDSGRSIDRPGKFEVLVDGQSIGTCDLTNQPVDQFIDQSLVIPLERTRDKESVKISFQPAKGTREVRAGFYECRIVKASQ